MSIPVPTVQRLTQVVRRALNEPEARPLEWSCEPLDVELINPLTAGLYRVAGTAQAGPGPARSWRVILKVIQHPDFTGTPLEFGYAELPEDWNYWRPGGAGVSLWPAGTLHVAVATGQVPGQRGHR
jgi:hypothetical protein